MSNLFIGLMSGTSLDGIDAVVADFTSGIRLSAAVTLPFDTQLRALLEELIERADTVSLDAIGEADARLGLAYANAVREVLDRSGASAADIRAIGCHGQTIRHSPDVRTPFTWQIGDPSRIAASTGIPVVADFRRMDVALGGQGAPLVPAFHASLFGSAEELRVIVNIGGIANVTRLGPAVTGYDTGPGNGLLDAWIRHNRGDAFDNDGEWAASGEVDESLLEELSADPFFRKTPPRSTGREYFNLPWLLQHLAGREISAINIQATLLALTVESIAREVLRCGAERVILCGGGARNSALRNGLSVAVGSIPVQTADEHGLDPDFVEATAFAWLARERLAERPGNVPSVTGANRLAVLGAIYLP